MADALPRIGTREGLKVEFKRADKLREKRGRLDLVRGVVAMRNASGGDIYVGALEQGDELTGFDPLTDTDRGHATALRDLIIDRIEPRPRVGRDVQIEEHQIAGGWVLRVRVHPRGKNEPPTCFVDGTSREFLERTGDRIAPIPHSTLVRLFSGASAKPAEPEFIDRALERHRAWIERWNGKSKGLLAISVMPSEDVGSLDLDSVKQLLLQPPPSIARPDGWTWHAGRLASVTRKRDDSGVEWLHSRSPVVRAQMAFILSASADDPGTDPYPHPDDHPYRCLDVSSFGLTRLGTEGSGLVWAPASGPWPIPFPYEPSEWPRNVAGRLDSRNLVETVASTVRLGASLMKQLTANSPSRDCEVATIVSLGGLDGWVWPGGRPPHPEHAFLPRHWFQVQAGYVGASLTRTAEEFRADPDEVTVDLLVQLYEKCAHPSVDAVSWRDIVWFNERREFAPPQ